MTKPFTDYENPLSGVRQEISSAMSALHMIPDPIPVRDRRPLREEGDFYFLSESDSNAQHAIEHLREACNQFSKLDDIYYKITCMIFQLDRALAKCEETT